MITIHKFHLTVGSNVIPLPPGWLSRALTVQLHNDCITMWVLLDTSLETVPREFAVVGTGEELDERYYERHSYVGTVQVRSLVWHVFELT